MRMMEVQEDEGDFLCSEGEVGMRRRRKRRMCAANEKGNNSFRM